MERQMGEARVYQLFPISLYKVNFDIDEDIKQLFYNEEYERMFSGNGYYTKNKYLLLLPTPNKKIIYDE